MSSEKAYYHIKSLILNGSLKSGSRVKEDIIAEKINVSRTPIRDAIRRLEADGLITTLPNAGAKVASWSSDELSEISQMRTLLEGYAAELAATKISSNEIDKLKFCCSKMKSQLYEINSNNVEKISSLNIEFHREVVMAAKNNRLFSAIEPLWHLPIILRKYSTFNTSRIGKSLQHHTEIVEALEQKDALLAGSIMRTHIRSARIFDKILIE